MSAREDLLNRVGSCYEHWINEFVEDHRNEVLRDAAESIRQDWRHLDGVSGTGEAVWHVVSKCADLIDPEVKEE